MQKFMTEDEARIAFMEFHLDGDEFIDATTTSYQVIAYWGSGCKHLTSTYDPVRLGYICDEWRDMFEEYSPEVEITVTRVDQPQGMLACEYWGEEEDQAQLRATYLDNEEGRHIDTEGYYLDASWLYWGWSRKDMDDAIQEENNA